jgi:hypothetical protein
MKKLYFIILCLLATHKIYAQEEEKHHLISVVIGHAHISKGLDENGSRKWLMAAAWGLDYTYSFNKKWAIGLHNDIVLDDFSVEGKETITRSFPVSSCLIGAFRPIEKLSVLAGAGGEFAKEGSYVLCRIGVEYGFELPKNWELSPSLTYDIKINGYDTWLFGLGVGKKF